ncbi:MAG: hypothetical protein ACRDHE_08965 [Ktedonobacterales bacterium]
MKIKYTFLSKWTVLILTLLTIGLIYGAVALGFKGIHVVTSPLMVVVALLIYVFAWFIALFDSIQEKRFGWTIGLIVLLPIAIGPILYSVLGPKNTK